MTLPAPALLVEMALEAGFDVVGFGPASPGDHGLHFTEWLLAGRHGQMGYLERNQATILDPTRWLPGARSAISLGFDYGRTEVELPGGGRIARYAAARDYHRALGNRLRGLRRRLERDGATGLRFGVDAAPLLERALAAQAGVGFLAKSTGIIHPRLGPWILLAELLTTDELPFSSPSPGSCGTCRACLDACPTDAIVAPFELDARRCLSYTTIEHRGPIARELRHAQGGWLFGCDICIEVCPFTSRRRPKPPDPDLALHPVLETHDLVAVLELSAEDWDKHWTGTAIRRATRAGLRRNAAVVIGNLGVQAAIPSLERTLEDPDSGVRSAAGWALARIQHGRAALARAIEREREPEIRRDLEQSMDEL